jgi:hypothetical protein
MMESIYAFDIPFQLLQLLISQDKNAVLRLENIGTLRGQVEAGLFVVLINVIIMLPLQLLAVDDGEVCWE